MSGTLHLTVTTPAQILVESGDVVAVRAEDQSGSFGILPGHADLLTVLVPSVLRWRTADGAARFCAVRGGVFTVAYGRAGGTAWRAGVGSRPGSPGARGARSRRARSRGSCRSRTLARRAARPDWHSRLDDRRPDIAVPFPRPLARPYPRNRELFFRSA